MPKPIKKPAAADLSAAPCSQCHADHCREVARVILAGFNHKERDNEPWRDEIAKILQREFPHSSVNDKIFKSMSVSTKDAAGNWSEPERI